MAAPLGNLAANGQILSYRAGSATAIPCRLANTAAKGEESQGWNRSPPRHLFAVSRGGIYFVLWPRIQYFDFTTGRTKTILTLEKETSLGLSVSPDERWLLYSQFDQDGSDLMLVENFH